MKFSHIKRDMEYAGWKITNPVNGTYVCKRDNETVVFYVTPSMVNNETEDSVVMDRAGIARYTDPGTRLEGVRQALSAAGWPTDRCEVSPMCLRVKTTAEPFHVSVDGPNITVVQRCGMVARGDLETITNALGKCESNSFRRQTESNAERIRNALSGHGARIEDGKVIVENDSHILTVNPPDDPESDYHVNYLGVNGMGSMNAPFSDDISHICEIARMFLR